MFKAAVHKYQQRIAVLVWYMTCKMIFDRTLRYLRILANLTASSFSIIVNRTQVSIKIGYLMLLRSVVYLMLSLINNLKPKCCQYIALSLLLTLLYPSFEHISYVRFHNSCQFSNIFHKRVKNIFIQSSLRKCKLSIRECNENCMHIYNYIILCSIKNPWQCTGK